MLHRTAETYRIVSITGIDGRAVGSAVPGYEAQYVMVFSFNDHR